MRMRNITLTLSSLSLLVLASCTGTSTVTSGDDVNPIIADKKFPVAFQYQNSTSQVISPYRPYNVINVKGLKTGHLARDPSTAKINRKTGKPNIATAKIFRIPELKKSKATTKS